MTVTVHGIPAVLTDRMRDIVARQMVRGLRPLTTEARSISSIDIVLDEVTAADGLCARARAVAGTPAGTLVAEGVAGAPEYAAVNAQLDLMRQLSAVRALSA